MEQAELGSSKCRAVDSQLNGHALEAKTLLQLTLKPHQGKTQRKWMGPVSGGCVQHQVLVSSVWPNTWTLSGNPPVLQPDKYSRAKESKKTNNPKKSGARFFFVPNVHEFKSTSWAKNQEEIAEPLEQLVEMARK